MKYQACAAFCYAATDLNHYPEIAEIYLSYPKPSKAEWAATRRDVARSGGDTENPWERMQRYEALLAERGIETATMRKTKLGIQLSAVNRDELIRMTIETAAALVNELSTDDDQLARQL